MYQFYHFQYAFILKLVRKSNDRVMLGKTAPAAATKNNKLRSALSLVGRIDSYCFFGTSLAYAAFCTFYFVSYFANSLENLEEEAEHHDYNVTN